MTKFIAIDGHGGSGKSTLAESLAKGLGADIIHTDDFASFDNPRNWWPMVIEKVFKPIQDGATKLSYPRSTWWEDHKPEPIVDQPVADVMILEGVSSLRKEFREYINFGIYVDTPKEIFLKRVFERDQGNDGKSDEEIIAIRNEWLEGEESYIARDKPEEYADIVIDGTRPIDQLVAEISLVLKEKEAE